MGTKNNPGAFDCYENALPDEPMFILLARDPHAPDLVDDWAVRRMRDIALGIRPKSDLPMVDEAQRCATAMREWRKTNDGKWRKGPTNEGARCPSPQPSPAAAPASRDDRLGRLRQAIIDHTKGEDMFWLGEILLAELRKETGYPSAGQPPAAAPDVAGLVERLEVLSHRVGPLVAAEIMKATAALSAQAAEITEMRRVAPRLTGFKALSADVESRRVLRMHFDHDVTDDDRRALVASINGDRAQAAALAAKEADYSSALSFIRTIGEELILAGMPGGDREVILANVRGMRDALKAKEAECERLREDVARGEFAQTMGVIGVCKTRIAELEAALRPFARLPTSPSADGCVEVNIDTAHITRARTALAGEEKP